MRHPILAALPLLCFSAGLAAQPPEPAPSAPALDRALAGRIRGPAHDCINLHDMHTSRIIDRTAIIYQQNGQRWFVNEPDGGRCTALRRNAAIVTRLAGTDRLCARDLVRVVDPVSRFDYGFCSLGPFIEYGRAPAR